MIKKTLLLATLLIIASAALTACGAADQPIQVGTDATWPPFEFVDEETKELVGFDIDLMAAVAERAGIEYEFVNAGFDPVLAGVAECQYDAAISAITITSDRMENMSFTQPYFAAGQLVTVAIDNDAITGHEDLAGYTVGAQIGTTGAIEVEAIEGAELKTYDDIGLAFQDLMNGQIDAIVADNSLALGYIAQNSDALKAVGDTFTAEEFGIAVCPENAELLATLDAALGELIEEGYVDELVAEWLAIIE
ncbi:MAG: basic amino acid ABC transporter substrate-binding protein [Anaerolineales bacterium]|nr:basic amino acid ABC transporter substrate-binding protein [Anaerolineales bacterium]